MNLFRWLKHHKKRIKNKYFPKRSGDYVFTFERFCSDFQEEHFERHFQAYRFAERFVKNAKVLDVGCGCGYGNDFFVKAQAERAVGIDYSWQAVRYAKERFASRNSHFLVMDAANLGFCDNYFDAVLSIENLEHVKDHEGSLREIRRILKPGGMLMLQTPNKEATSPDSEKPGNEFHVKEFYFEELKPLLNKYFENVLIFENSKKIENDTGRMRQEARLRTGNNGILPDKTHEATFRGETVEIHNLNNAVSFFCLCT